MKPPDLRREQRRDKRRLVTGIARMAQRTRVILGRDKRTVYPCKILDASDNGYCISLKPMLTPEIGDEFVLEHTDRTQRRVRVCWATEYEAGLKIVQPDQTMR